MSDCQVEVLYFALFREARGVASEVVATTASSPRELYAELGLPQIFPLDTARLRVAINDEFAGWDAPLHQGDRVVFLAPVAGG